MDMDEKSYWAELYQLLQNDWPVELEPLGYCDWIEVSRYLLSCYDPRIEGKIGLIGGQTDKVRFVLSLNGRPQDLSEINWRGSFPMAKPRHWISYDEESKTLFLNPVSK